MIYLALNPISRSSPVFSASKSSFTFPSSEHEVIVITLSFMDSLIRLFLPSFDRSEALSTHSISSDFLSFTFIEDVFGIMSWYFINSPAINLIITLMLSIIKTALLLSTNILISSLFEFRLVSDTILLISFIILAEIIILWSSLLTISSDVIAILYPSIATILILSLAISRRIPVITPFVWSILAAKEVFLIISANFTLSKVNSFASSSVFFMFGNSSDDIPTRENSDVRHLIVIFSSSQVNSISLLGSFLTMSPNSFAWTTIEPSSELDTSIEFSIVISISDAVKVAMPEFILILIPLSVGIVVLELIALDTILRVLVNSNWLHVNFIKTS